MRIVIDNIIFGWQKSGGISAVWYELIKRMLASGKLKDAFRFINYEGSDRNIFFRELHLGGNSHVVKTISRRMFVVKRYLSQSFSSDVPFIFHSSYYRLCSNPKAVNIVTVHDFTYERYTHGIKKYLHVWSKDRVLRNADYIVCISENTKKDLLSYVSDVDPDKIRVIYNGASDDFHRLSDAERVSEEPFLVFVGNRAPYKNFDLAVKTAALSGMKLVVVGEKLNEQELAVTREALGKNFEEVGRISNARLNELYNKAFALIYPSSYEGFGLPVVEAQKSGCPVLALDTSSIPEIIGDRNQLVKEATPDAFLLQINRLRQAGYRTSIIDNGEINSRQYSWDNTFRQYADLYDEIMRNYNEKRS